MNIGLVDCNAIFDKHPFPLGVMRIAAVAEKLGHNIELIQVDKHIPITFTPNFWKSLPTKIVDLITNWSFDILGFNTRGDTLPLVMEVARLHKLKHKNVPVVLGGPGAAFVEQKILEAFPFVDIIVRGEGEETFAELLSTLQHTNLLATTKGITFRNDLDEIINTPDRPIIRDLDCLPDIPYYLIGDVLSNPELWWICIEVGRGCPNGCHFCSTCAFWDKFGRMRSPEKVIAEMKMLNRKYGIHTFILIHDNICSKKNFVKDFCNIVHDELPEVSWRISASLNYMSPEMIKVIANSGCTEVYFGVETASRKNIPGKFLSRQDVLKALDIFREHDLKTTKSYILGFPNETSNDLDQTLRLAIEAQASAPLSLAEATQIHTLALSPGSKLYEQYKHQLLYTGIMSGRANPKITSMEQCLDMCKHHPSIFSFYASFQEEKDSVEVIELKNFYSFLIEVLPRSIFVALHQLKLTPRGLYKYFKKYVSIHKQVFPDCTNDKLFLSKLYLHRFLINYFAKIIVEKYHETGCSKDFVQFFLNLEQQRIIFSLENHKCTSLFPDHAFNNKSLLNLIPIMPRTTKFLSLNYDPDRLFFKFRHYNSTRIPHTNKNTDIVYYLPRNKINAQEPLLSLHAIKLNRLSAHIFRHIKRLIDGKRSCSQIIFEVDQSLKLCETTPVISTEEIQNTLMFLIKKGVLIFLSELS